MLDAVKAWPGSLAAGATDSATASLDRVSTRGWRSMIQIGSGVVPLSPDHAVNPKRTTDVLQKPDNSKSYRHAGISGNRAWPDLG